MALCLCNSVNMRITMLLKTLTWALISIWAHFISPMQAKKQSKVSNPMEKKFHSTTVMPIPIATLPFFLTPWKRPLRAIIWVIWFMRDQGSLWIGEILPNDLHQHVACQLISFFLPKCILVGAAVILLVIVGFFLALLILPLVQLLDSNKWLPDQVISLQKWNKSTANQI